MSGSTNITNERKSLDGRGNNNNNDKDERSSIGKGQTGTSENNSDKQLESLVKKKSTQGAKSLGPRRKSMYDHVEIDFVKSGKKTHLFRLLVAGSLHEEDPTELMKTKRNMIDEINAQCHDENATGFLLCYPRQFIHVLEGSEDTLNSYLSRCADAYENATGDERSKTPKVRMLVLGYFSIQERFLPRWIQTKFNPPRSTSKVESGFRKNLFELVRTSLILAIIMSKQPADLGYWPEQTEGPKTKERREQDVMLMQYLPNPYLIMYVLKDKPRRINLKTPKQFIQLYTQVPDFILTKETDWPIPCRIAPYN